MIDPDATARRQQRLRRRFQPARVRLLFLGEAPPASGRFFYQRDSGLYRAMRDAFLSVDPSIDDETFLPAFQASGCHLIDLCRQPVDRLDSHSRRAICRSSENSLARAIARLQPDMIATLLRSVEGNVARSASRAGWRGRFIYLPYPGRWSRHKSAFLRALIPEIQALMHGSGGGLLDSVSV